MKIFKIGALAFAMLMVTFSIAGAEWTGASGEQYISSFSSVNKVYCPAFAVGPNYELYAVWAQGNGISVPYEVHFGKSTDNGATWTSSSADQMISPNDGNGVYSGGIYGARRIDIAVNSLGHIFVVWPEDYVSASFDTTQEIMMVMSTDGGNNWIHSDTDFPVSDTLSPQGANTPNIAIDLNDNIHVVWNQTDTVSGVAEIFYSYSSDNGATWTGRSGDRMISYANGYSSSYSDIDVGPDNKIHVVWRDYYALTDNRLLYGVSSDGGTTFSSETSDSVISTATYTINYPRVKAKPFVGHVHVIYAYNDTAMYVGTTDGGANWNETMIWAGEGYDMYGPDIAVTTTGTMVAILDEDDPRSLELPSSNRQIFASYSFDYGLTWSAALDPVSHYDTTVTLTNFDRTYIPSVLITNTDVLHCLYSTNVPPTSNSYQEMAYSRSDSLGVLPGAIRGTVTELDGTTPIQNVEVVVYNSDMVALNTDITNVYGQYYFGLEPDTYSLSFSIYTHNDTSITDVLVESNIVTTVDLMMSPTLPGTVGGTVFEETGSFPLQYVVVEAYDADDSLWAADTTDVSGYYEISLWPAIYNLVFSVDLFNDTTISQEVTHDASIVLDVNMSWAIPADDIGPLSIDVPSPYMLVSQPYSPTITVTNFGYQDQNFNLNLVIEDATSYEVYNETISGASVDSLGNIQLVFGSDFTPIIAGDYTLTATTVNAGDEVPGNDVLAATITAYQHEGYGGPDDYGYSFRDNTAPCGPTFNWIDISETGFPIHFDHDTTHYFMRGPYPIGFNFEYYGHVYDSMYVNSHGSLHIGIRDVWSGSNDCPLPNSTSPYAPMALVFWDYKEVQWEIGQGVYYQYFDDPGVDYTVIQWNVSNQGEDDTLEFEIILYADGRLVYQYNNVSEDVTGGLGQEASIGLEFDVAPELYGLSYLCDDDNPGNRLYDGLAIEWIKDDQLPGSVSGTVTDASTLNPVEGVYVEAAGTGISDVTDVNGDYTLPGLYACDYGIFFSHPAYVDSTVAGITVTPDNVTNLDVALQPQIFGYEYFAGDANMAVGQWPPQVIGGDVTYLVNYFRGINGPCLIGDPTFYCSGDVNGDCQVIGSDVTRLVTYFRGLAAIVPCPDYESAWPTPDDFPETAPSGWPNCVTAITSDDATKGGFNSR